MMFVPRPQTTPVLAPVTSIGVIIFYLSWTTSCCSADTMVGCGGFIRWHDASNSKTKIAFEHLKVQLYSGPGDTLKDVTDVLPNGAFTMPLYDREPCRLRLAAPKGWHISPSDGHVINLKSDPYACSRDFDFYIIGFGIYGQVVTYGMNTGPTGLIVRLTKNRFEKLNTTQPGGFFSVAPLQPGTYELSISDTDRGGPEHLRARTSITVVSDNVILREPIMLMGHFIRGHVVDFESQPLVGATVLLLADTSVDTTMLDCNRLLDSLDVAANPRPELTFRLVPICLCRTDDGGYFSFDRLPGGNYSLYPNHSVRFDDASVVYAFQPEFVQISLGHSNVDLGLSTFKADALRLPPGRLLWPDGTPVPSAKIYFGAREDPIISDVHGYYQPGFLKPGTYLIRALTSVFGWDLALAEDEIGSILITYKGPNLTNMDAEATDVPVEAHGAEFSEHHLQLSHLSSRLPDLQPHKLSLCGMVNIAENLTHSQLHVALLITNVATKKVHREAIVSQNSTLPYCIFLAPGRYQLAAEIHIRGPSDRQVLLTPSVLQVDLSGKPVSNVVFTQFRARIRGRVVRLPVSCSDSDVERTWRVHLKSLDHETSLYSRLTTFKENPDVSYFEISDILPGDYLLNFVSETENGLLQAIDGWCWLPSDMSASDVGTLPRRLHVPSTDLNWETDSTLDFIQSGYAILVNLELPLTLRSWTQIVLKSTTNSSVRNRSEVIAWELQTRSNKICLPQTDVVYEFKPHSTCFVFDVPHPVVLLPKSECHLSLEHNPVIHLRVQKVPLFIRLSIEEPLDHNVTKLVTRAPLVIDVIYSTTGSSITPSSKEGKVKTVSAKWFSSNDHVFAETMVWHDISSAVTFKPRPAPNNDSRWFYTYMLDDPPSLRIDLTQLTFEAFMSDPATSFLPPLMDNASSASASTLMNDCMNLFSWQHLNFTLHLAVVLRGQVVPATSKVNVELYSNPGTLRESTEDLDWHTYRQPLLPFHDDRTMPSTGTNQSRGTISVTATETTLQSSPIATTLTDSFGMFLFGPVRVPACLSWPRLSNVLADPSVCFKVALRKPGYEFAEVPLDSTVDSKSSSLNWLFKATKFSLVEVVVKVKSDTANELLPLQDVFVSLIGEDHRGNQFTDKLGVANFVGLVPGQYYLRAMMKEHVFHMVAPHDGPPGSSAPILVTEGISVHMELLAERVAFSVSGVVISLDQSPLENVLVEAQWLPNLTTSSHIVNFVPPANTCRLTPEDASNVPREQSWSDLDGRFLIRRLLPGCTYSITVHTTPSGQIPRHCSNEPLLSTNPVIDRTIPPSIHLLMPSHDAAGLTFIALPQMYMSTISIDVDTDDEFVPALHLTLFPSDHPQMVLVRHEFSSSPLFRLSGSLMSRFIGCELVALLEHSLDPAAYTSIGTQQFVFKPRANISEYHTFIFRPKQLLMGNPKPEL